MNSTIPYIILMVLGLIIPGMGYSQCTSCYNMDFEKNNLQCWKGELGDQDCYPNQTPGCAFANASPGIDPDRQQVVAGGMDTITGGLIPMNNPFRGTRSLQLGNWDDGSEAEALYRTFQVTPGNEIFAFSYAVVLEVPSSHDPWEMPYFEIVMTDNQGDTVGCTSYKVVAGNGLPGFKSFSNSGTTPGGWNWNANGIYKEWSTVVTPLTQYVGQYVTLRIVTGDCSLGAHAGYAYFDGWCMSFGLTQEETCDGVILRAPKGLVDYEWINKLTGQVVSSGPNEDSILVSTPGPGTYTCTVIGENNCPVTLSATIHVNPQLQVDSIVTEPNSCFGIGDASIDIFTTGGYQPITYSIDGGINYITNSTFSNLFEGNYQVIVKDSLGCTDTSWHGIIGPPEIQINMTVDDNDCYWGCEGKAKANVFGGVPPYSYSWVGAAGTADSVYNLCSGFYQVHVTDSLNCEEHKIFNVDHGPPALIESTADTTICSGDMATLIAQAYAGTAPYDYYWDNTLGTQTNVVQPPGNQSYSVYAIDANGCYTDTSLIKVGIFPNLQLYVADDASVCPGDVVNLIAVATGGDGNYTYAWDNSMGNNKYAMTQEDSSGTFYYNVTVNDGCGYGPATDQVEIVVKEIPEFELTIDKLEGCQALTVDFGNAISWTDVDFVTLELGNGEQLKMTGPTTYTFEDFGTFNISLDVLGKNECHLLVDSASSIEVFPKPFAAFKYSPSEEDLDEVNALVQFRDLSERSVIWYWDFDNGDTSMAQHPTYFFPDTGDYTVRQIVETEHGCLDTAYNDVYIRPTWNIFVPNAFTPGQDGINDGFFFEGHGILKDELSFTVFNRWGDIIYHTDDFIPWNGRTRQGAIAKQDVYVWKLYFRDVFKNPHQMMGHVTLIR
ncbi:MAG: gliding motility-associated C-terminal domain-containing protein [Flavobacteriales bacterium]|nr:gliding motility-associated C-terminal domain-containing protein [Flavobacteriales bacterium]